MPHRTQRSDILVEDLISAMWADAHNERDPEHRAKLLQEAEQLQKIWSGSKYALAPTRDQMAASVGNVWLSLSERLDEIGASMQTMLGGLNEVSTLALIVKGLKASVEEYIGQLPLENRAQIIELTGKIPELEQRINELAKDVAALQKLVQTP